MDIDWNQFETLLAELTTREVEAFAALHLEFEVLLGRGDHGRFDDVTYLRKKYVFVVTVAHGLLLQ